MSWLLALLYFASGLVSGACGFCYLVTWVLMRDPITRLEFLRIFATRWPETVERAMLDTQIMAGGDEEETLTLEPIEFKMCNHCHLPWPTYDGKLIRHPAVSARPYREGGLNQCKGSETSDYDAQA